jgi:hypothetical protein
VTVSTPSNITLNYNSSSIVGVALTNASISRSVKVSVFAPTATTVSIAEVQTASLN